MFDLNNFLNVEVTGEMSTEAIPVPEGEYTAQAGQKISVRKIDVDNEDRFLMEIPWEIADDGTVQAVTGRDKNFARQTIWLDITPQGGLDLSKGMNVDLGRLREALGQNRADAPWSAAMIKGQAAKVKVTHRMDTKTGRIFAEVKGVAAL